MLKKNKIKKGITKYFMHLFNFNLRFINYNANYFEIIKKLINLILKNLFHFINLVFPLFFLKI